MRKTYRISPTFWDDHVARDLASSERVLKAGKFCVYVSLNADEYSELLSDAKFYANNDGEFDPEYKYLMDSAKRVVAVLTKEGPPEAPKAPEGPTGDPVTTLFGWCLPGPEAAHRSCRVQFVGSTDGRLHSCRCACHVEGGGNVEW